MGSLNRLVGTYRAKKPTQQRIYGAAQLSRASDSKSGETRLKIDQSIALWIVKCFDVSFFPAGPSSLWKLYLIYFTTLLLSTSVWLAVLLLLLTLIHGFYPSLWIVHWRCAASSGSRAELIFEDNTKNTKNAQTHADTNVNTNTALCIKMLLPQVEAEPNWSLRSAGTEVGGEHHRQQFLRLGR